MFSNGVLEVTNLVTVNGNTTLSAYAGHEHNSTHLIPPGFAPVPPDQNFPPYHEEYSAMHNPWPPTVC